jgi:hypothetical protein
VVDEDEYTKKKRQRMEEVVELEEKRKLEEFKKTKRQQMKRMRNEDDETIPEGWKVHTACKRLKRMPEEEEETLDVSGWWRMAEGRSARTGILSNQLEKEKARVLRRMEVMELERIISDSQGWWIRSLAWAGIETPPQYPKTINASGSYQDQNIREVPLSTIQQEEQAPLTSIHQEEQAHQISIQQEILWSDKLVGYVGWWRMVEKEGEKEGLAKDKDRRKEGDRKRKTDAKVSFLKQYYPEAHSSPGGSLKITNNIRKQTHTRTDDNSDRETGNIVKRHTLETFSQHSLPFSKRKTENIHTGDTVSSPSKKQKLSDFSCKLNFWVSKDTLSGGYLEEPSRGLKWKPEEQQNGGRMGGSE